MSFHRLSGLRYKGQCFCQLAKARSPKGKGQVLSSPVASNEASALLPAGRPGGRVARDDNAMCWDGCLLLCSGGKKPAGRATRDACLERRMCVATMARRITPRMRKALPMGRAAHQASLGVPGMVPSGEPGRRLQEPAPGLRCSYPPAGRCWASVPGHRHVRSHQCDAAPTRIAAAVRRTVTAAGSDGPHLSHAEPGGPSLAAAGVFPGAVGSIPLSAMHPMICPMGSDGVFNMRLI